LGFIGKKLKFRGPITIYPRTWLQNFRTWVTKLKMVISHLKTAPTLFITFFITPGEPFQQEEEDMISLSCHDYWNVWHLFGYKAREKRTPLPSPTVTIASAITISLLSGKRMHSLAIKAREGTEQQGGSFGKGGRTPRGEGEWNRGEERRDSGTEKTNRERWTEENRKKKEKLRERESGGSERRMNRKKWKAERSTSKR